MDIRLLIPGLSFDPTDPFARSLGGSETAGLQLAAELAKDQANTVTAFAQVDRPANWRGVNIVPGAQFDQVMCTVPCDLAIVQRAPMAFARRLESKVNFLWVHDLLFARRLGELEGSMHSIDRIVTVSRFQRDQWRSVAPQIPESSFLVARNGIDLDLVEAAPHPQRERHLIVCAARPERGVDVLLTHIFPRILKEVPTARLELATYDVPNPAMEPLYAQLRQIAAQYGDKVVWHGPLNKADLYALYHRASLYLYPTPSPGDESFSETSCISVMEAMACGCPVIASKRGGLIETVGDAGILVELDGAHAATEGSVNAFVGAAVRCLTSKAEVHAERWGVMRDAGLERGWSFGWREVAEQMVAAAEAIMAEQCSDPVRLARHFIRRQDIEAAKVTLDATTGLVGDSTFHHDVTVEKAEELGEIAAWLEQRYRHTRDPETLAAYYAERVGPNNGHVFEGLMAAPRERFREHAFIRFDQIDREIRSHLGLPAEPKILPADTANRLRILDFGCSQGECPIVIANRLGADVVGADASWSEIERARRLADRHADRPEGLTFVTANERDLSALQEQFAKHGPFDAAIMAEVLEHLIDPINLVERIEAMVRPGGVIVITVPYGPWETQQPEPARGQHLREWDYPDLQDIFGAKPDLVVHRVPLQSCPDTGEILGNTVLGYRVDHQPLRPIDWGRKMRSQRPRQTLSAAMMLGGQTSHETLHWCLRPVSAVADEIVVADAGMTEEARRIALQYGARIFPSPSPLEVGFEVPRNMGLERCRGDWVLMIDSDERLLSPSTMWRYLRENSFHSYAIPQHHFAVDAQWKPDLPGRLFRRRPDDQGKVLRFFGMLHEHAEFGINQGAGRAMVLGDVRIGHVGYLDQAIRAGRFVRNLPLLRLDLETYPDRALCLLVMCRDSMIQARWLMAQAGINPVPGSASQLQQAAGLCRDVIRIWDLHFADDVGPMSRESEEFYHDACMLLGCDVVADGIHVQRQGVGAPVGPTAVHFFSIDHYRRWLASRTKAATEPLAGAGY